MNRATANTARVLPLAKPQPAYRLWPAPVLTNYPSRPVSQPVQMRKLKYHVSASLDGYVLEPQHGVEKWARADDSIRYQEFLHAYGIVLMGRNTYEAHLRAGVADPYPDLMSYVFSRSLRPAANSPVEVIAEDAAAWVRRLKACPGKDLYLHGGARLATSLFAAGLIDEVIVELVPVLQGTGSRRLLSELEGEVALERENGVAYEDGTVRLTYRIRNSANRIDRQ
ncbi:MAG TPA: dihydrofolate reductase family protein [Luteimonas sp.]|nr:dihydrofolate reductase family protein [Luteimonas sp.]